jgi:hypothetical protein
MILTTHTTDITADKQGPFSPYITVINRLNDSSFYYYIISVKDMLGVNPRAKVWSDLIRTSPTLMVVGVVGRSQRTSPPDEVYITEDGRAWKGQESGLFWDTWVPDAMEHATPFSPEHFKDSLQAVEQ